MEIGARHVLTLDVETPVGPARVRLDRPDGDPALLLVLGHGAGGDIDAPDLVAVREAVLADGAAVASVTQPYRVAGRRAPAPARQLDAAWTVVVSELRGPTGGVPLVVGGRSSGARVACRTAREVGASAIVALAFPLHPPGKPEKSRAAELETGLPTLVVNGDRDPFGVPAAGGEAVVHIVPGGDHSLRRDPAAVGATVAGWLRERRWAPTSRS
jgi:predicted alpha/beta-hydrolase family hydrolase